MKFLQNCLSITLLVALCSVAVAQTARTPIVSEPDKPKHNQVVVEFPGHKYSLEIAAKTIKETVNSEERSIPTVFAYVSDTHFEPLQVDAKEIRLNFIVDKKSKSFVLLPAKADAEKDKKPQTVFELKDPELVKLISGGWQGNAQASMLVGKTPFTGKLIKAKDFKPHKH